LLRDIHPMPGQELSNLQCQTAISTYIFFVDM
jgi:hypothetical protein